MTNQKSLPVVLRHNNNSRSSSRHRQRRRNIIILFGISVIIILAVIINIAFLSNNNNNNNKNLLQDQKKQPHHSISAAKENFSLNKANKNRQQDFMKSYHNPNININTNIAAGAVVAATASDDLPPVIRITPPVELSAPVVEKIKVILPQKEIEWIQRRDQQYIIEYMGSDNNRSSNQLKNQKKARWNTKINFKNSTEVDTIYTEDNEGPWLDFVIAGHPKCGTTTLVANLAMIAPMKIKDFCVGEMSTLLGYVYRIWREKFPEILLGPQKYMYQPQPPLLLSSSNSISTNLNNNQNNLNTNIELKGAKCPRFLGDPNIILKFGPRYPKTKIIFGIRHPVLWFTSFFNMGHVGDLYSKMKICPNMNLDGNGNDNNNDNNNNKYYLDKNGEEQEKELCIGECRCGLPVCFHRARLHLPIARLGKTLLTELERQLIAPNDPDGGIHLINGRIKNPFFLYEQTQMFDKNIVKTNNNNTNTNEDEDEDTNNSKEQEQQNDNTNNNGSSFWDSLAKFIGVSYIPNESYHSSKGKQHNKTLCTDYYDEFRSKMMEHSYNMSIWLEEYLLPIAEDPTRPDVVIHNVNEFRTIIQSYKDDPCQRLIRNNTNGEYILKSTIDVDNGWGPGIMTRIIGTGKVKACRGAYESTRRIDRKETKEEQRQNRRQQLQEIQNEMN